MGRNTVLIVLLSVLGFLVRNISTLQVDSLQYVIMRRNLKSKDCRTGLTDGPYRLYSETYIKLFTCVTIPSLVPGEIATETIRIDESSSKNATQYFDVKSCPSLYFCEHSAIYGNQSLDPCVSTIIQANKCIKKSDTYMTIMKYRTPWTPSGLYYLPHNYNGVLTGLYNDDSCSTRIGYHFTADEKFSGENLTNHKPCTETEIKDSKKCRPVDMASGKTHMKQVCVRESPLRYEWFWVILSLLILLTVLCCMGACPCFCATCDREGVKKKVVPEWQRTYTFIHDDDETLDAERISINRLKGDVSVKIKKCVLIVRKLGEVWHVLLIGFMILTSVFTVVTYVGTVSIWVFVEYGSFENIMVSCIILLEFILVIPTSCISCYCLCPSGVSDQIQCFGPYCGSVFSIMVFNIYFAVFLLLDMYYFYYAALLFGSGMVFFESHVWVYMAVFLVKTCALLFLMVEICIRVIKLMMGLKGLLESLSQVYISVIRFVAKTCQNIGLVKRGPKYQPI